MENGSLENKHSAGEEKQEEISWKDKLTDLLLQGLAKYKLYLFGLILLVLMGVVVLILGLLVWTDLTWEGWLVICLIILVWKNDFVFDINGLMMVFIQSVAVLVVDIIDPAFVFILDTVILLVSGVIAPSEALDGFSNSSVISIGALFVVAKGVELSGCLSYVVRYLLGKPRNVFFAYLRFIPVVELISAVVNDTPVVATLMPAIIHWSVYSNGVLPVSKLLIPLSYAALLGGTITIQGTSTNLIVQGLAEDLYPDQNIPYFGIGIVGVPVAIAGFIYIACTGNWLLPNRNLKNDPTAQWLLHVREYVVTFSISQKSYFNGKTVAKSGLDCIPGAPLLKIYRNHIETEEDGAVLSRLESVPLSPTSILCSGDELKFKGTLDKVIPLFKIDGLSNKRLSLKKTNRLCEAVISMNSSLVGKSIDDINKLYDVRVLSLFRDHSDIESALLWGTPFDTLLLNAGDNLVMETHESFYRKHQYDKNFSLITENKFENKEKNYIELVWVLSILFAMIGLNIAGTPLIVTSLSAASLYIVTNVVTFREALHAIKFDLLLLISFAFSLAKAVEITGAGEVVARSLISWFSFAGGPGILAGLFIFTAGLSSIISNAATVTLVFPIANKFIQSGTVSFYGVIYTLMIAGSTAYATPIGYQTNLMVQGPGGYKFTDYFKIGFPLDIIAGVITVTMVSLIWPPPS